MGVDWNLLKDITGIVTPFIIFIIGVIIIPILWRINRRHFIFEAKIDSMIYANKTLNGELKSFSEEWSKNYDREFSRRLSEQKFVEGK